MMLPRYDETRLYVGINFAKKDTAFDSYLYEKIESVVIAKTLSKFPAADPNEVRSKIRQ